MLTTNNESKNFIAFYIFSVALQDFIYHLIVLFVEVFC